MQQSSILKVTTVFLAKGNKMSHKSDYHAILKKTLKEKMSAEIRLQAANLNYSAACADESEELRSRFRQEIHALQDIILDCINLVFFCTVRIGEGNE